MIRVNTQALNSELPDKTPLLHWLRDELGLAGPKLGCGEGECGACMVLVDGRPQTSCNLPLWAVQGHEVTTLEGLGEQGQQALTTTREAFNARVTKIGLAV